MGMTAPSFGAILSSTPFYQNFFSQPVSYTVDVLSQIPQAAATVENILNADPNLTGFQTTPDYGAALSNYNSITGGDQNYYQSVSDIGTMEQLDEAQAAMALAKANYWNTALDPTIAPSTDINDVSTFGDLYPVGMINGTPVNASFSGTPAGQYYLDNGTIKYSEPDNDNTLGSILSVATGGVSDLFEGNTMGSGTLDIINKIAPPDTFVGQVLPSMLMPAEAANRDLADIWSHGGDFIDKFSTSFDRLADPTNSVNYSLERGGEQLPEDVRAAMPAVLGTIGTAIYPVAGSALGYGIGAHLAGQSSTDALTGAGVSALASYGGQGLSPMVSEAVGGGTLGGVAGGAAQGAVQGGITGIKPAIQTGSWDPVLYGAGIGGVVGGITGGIKAYGADEAATRAAAEQYYIDRYLQQNPSPYYDTITGQMITPSALSYDELLSRAYQAANPGFTPFTVDPLLQHITPADTALQGTLENSYTLGTTDPNTLADKFYTDRYLQQNPSPYYDPITQQMVYPPGLTTDEALVQDYTKANPTPDVRYQEPSIWNTIQDYAGKAGEFVLDNSNTLLKLASILGGGTGAVAAPSAFPGGDGRPGMSSPDAVTEFLMQHGGTGKGKSKGLGAGEVKGPYYGNSFMPGLNEIKKYDEQGLYYT